MDALDEVDEELGPLLAQFVKVDLLIASLDSRFRVLGSSQGGDLGPEAVKSGGEVDLLDSDDGGLRRRNIQRELRRLDRNWRADSRGKDLGLRSSDRLG